MYGTNAHSSEAESLRMRRNDYFSSPEGSVADFPSYPPYSELPFTSLKRRKQGSNFVKWTMRGVLASPVIVLVLWSTCAVLFANKQTSQVKPSSRQLKLPKFTKATGQGQQMMYMQPQGKAAYMLQQQAQQLGNEQQELAPQQGSQMNAGQMMAVPQNTVQYMAAQPQEVSGGQMMAANQNMVNPGQYMITDSSRQEQQPLSVITPGQFLATQQQSQPFGATEQVQPLGATAQAQPLGVTAQAQPLTAMTEQGQPLGVTAQTQLLGAAEQAQEVAQAQPMGSAHDRARPHRPQPRAVLDAPVKQQVFYYDPKDATKTGELQIPDTVYDEDGNRVSLQALQGSQIFLEPPKQQISEQPQQLTVPTNIKKWGESTIQDQSIIVSTVAVMALLVGALSARRLRSRSFLSSCIENESLEDDVAYDTAYTTTDNSYNTFGGWKGDLEKFDV